MTGTINNNNNSKKIIRKPITLEKEKFFLIKKITLIAAFSLICLTLICLIFGAIPLRGRAMGVVPLVNTVLETIFIGKTSFVYFLGNVAFCGFYIYTLVKAIIDIIVCIKSMKLWLSNEDNKKTRIEARTVVITLNNCITRYLVLLMISYMITAFNIGVMNTILLCLLIGGSLAVNIAKNIIYKGELVDSVVTALNRTIILLASLFLVFFSQLQTLDILNAFSRMGNAAEAGAFSGAFIGQIFCESVLKCVDIHKNVTTVQRRSGSKYIFVLQFFVFSCII